MKYIIPISVGVLYVVQGFYHLYKGQYGFSTMWLAYGLANAGLCFAMAEGQEGH